MFDQLLKPGMPVCVSSHCIYVIEWNPLALIKKEVLQNHQEPLSGYKTLTAVKNISNPDKFLYFFSHKLAKTLIITCAPAIWNFTLPLWAFGF